MTKQQRPEETTGVDNMKLMEPGSFEVKTVRITRLRTVHTVNAVDRDGNEYVYEWVTGANNAPTVTLMKYNKRWDIYEDVGDAGIIGSAANMQEFIDVVRNSMLTLNSGIRGTLI